MMDAFDEKLKDLDLPQGLKELLSLSLSDEIKQKLCSIPDDQVEKVIWKVVNEANKRSVETFEDALRRRIQL